MFANNPSVCAITEAIENIGVNKENIKLISIAPPSEKVIIKDGFIPTMRGIIRWNSDLISMALVGTSQKDAYIAKFLLKEDKYLRIVSDISINIPNGMDICSKKIINELTRAGHQYVVNHRQEIQKFFNLSNFVAMKKDKEELING
jgi:hypothetical protein